MHWDRGDEHLALPCFRRLNHPNPMVMGMMAEAILKKGDRYEAAEWFLKSAQSLARNDQGAIQNYRRYLEIKPDYIKVQMDLATRFEACDITPEALTIYARNKKIIAADSAKTFRIGKLFSSSGRNKDAIELYRLSLKKNQGMKSLWVSLAETYEDMNLKIDAAQAWQSAWNLDPKDLSIRNRAMAHLEATGRSADSLLQTLVEKSLESNPKNGSLHFKLAEILLRKNQREAAYIHLDQALKSDPKNNIYQGRIPDAIEGDSLIKVHFTYLKSQSEKPGASAKLLQLSGRGYSLIGDKKNACRTWVQLKNLDIKNVEGRGDIFQDLAVCPDPASQNLAEALGEKITTQASDKETLKLMIQITTKNKSFAKAAAYSSKLVTAYPEEGAASLALAKNIQASGDENSAKELLTAIITVLPNPEASMILGKIYLGKKDCTHAAEQFALASNNYPEASKMRAECLVELKDLQGAAAEYGSHNARTGDQESLRQQAKIFHDLGNNTQEIQALEALNAKSKTGENDKLRLGLLQLSQGDTSKAITLFIELLKARPNIPADTLWAQVALVTGNYFARQGESAKAIKLLNQGLKNASPSLTNRSPFWIKIGDAHSDIGQWKDAFAAYSQGLATDPHNGELVNGQLQAAKKLGDKKGLEIAYRAVYELDANDEEAMVSMAQTYRDAKDYKQASQLYRQLANLHPKDAKILENLGNTLAMIPDLQAAGEPLQAAIDLGAESDEVYINRARAFRVEGSKDMAASILEFLLSRNPKSYMAYLWSSKFAEEDGNRSLSLEMFKKAAKITPPKTVYPGLANQELVQARASEGE